MKWMFHSHISFPQWNQFIAYWPWMGRYGVLLVSCEYCIWFVFHACPRPVKSWYSELNYIENQQWSFVTQLIAHREMTCPCDVLYYIYISIHDSHGRQLQEKNTGVFIPSTDIYHPYEKSCECHRRVCVYVYQSGILNNVNAAYKCIDYFVITDWTAGIGPDFLTWPASRCAVHWVVFGNRI